MPAHDGLWEAAQETAGDAAARSIEMMIGRYTKTSRVRLPRGKDALDVGPVILREKLQRALRRLSC